MSDAFQDRENTFEKQFAHDEAIRFRAVARRNRAVALWVADMKGLSGADAEKYADDFVGAQVGRSDDDVAAALKADLERGDVDLSDHRLRKKMDEEMAACARLGQRREVGRRYPSTTFTGEGGRRSRQDEGLRRYRRGPTAPTAQTPPRPSHRPRA